MRDVQTEIKGRAVDGATLMTLQSIGYETAYRAGHATCPHYHNSGAWTAVGVAAMVARMLGAMPNAASRCWDRRASRSA